MIDPKKLNAGDVVVFGGAVDRTVYYLDDAGVHFKGQSDGFIRFNCDFWKITELKKPKLPRIPFLSLTEDGRYNNGLGHNFTPEWVLMSLKSQIASLEAAGVKETE